MVIKKIIQVLKRETQAFPRPLIDQVIKEYGNDPFLILIACLLSLRSKDIVTIHISRALFARAQTPQQLLKLSRSELERLLHAIGFYKTKARVLHGVSKALIEQFGGKVPHGYDELISIKGIGPKTANLVLGAAFGKPALCVDTHVHRISNRLGIIKTKTVGQTELALKKVVSKCSWTVWNTFLVMWGQQVCTPVSPKCSQCALNKLCKRVGVTKSR